MAVQLPSVYDIIYAVVGGTDSLAFMSSSTLAEAKLTRNLSVTKIGICLGSMVMKLT